MNPQDFRPRPFYPTFNHQRPPSADYRPQTPIGYSSSYAPPTLNQSYSKFQNQGFGLPPPQRNNFSRSRISLSGSQASNLSNLAN